MNIKHWTGIEGQVELVGYKAVVAMFLRWTLERRGEDGSGKPIWTLRASLSYPSDPRGDRRLNSSISKRITIKSDGREYVCQPVQVDGVEAVPFIDKQTDKYTVEAIILCPVEKRP